MDEDLRRAGRARTKRNIHIAKRAALYLAETVKSIHEENKRKMQLADKHQQAVRPIQSELTEIDEQLLKIISANKPVDQTLVDRWRELRDALMDLNKSLETNIAERDARIRVLEGERVALAPTANSEQYEGDLFRYGDPDKLANYAEAQRGAYSHERTKEIYREIIDE